MVTVFGLGFVGLTTALGFADAGIRVYGIDVDSDRKALIESGELPFLEPGLDEALKRNINRNFIVTDSIKDAIEHSDFVFFCVGTPYNTDGSANLTYLFSAIDGALDNIGRSSYKVLITKSTIPPSTTAEKIKPHLESKGFSVGQDIGLANNPEFLREGHCWEDFVKADRIVLGVENAKDGDLLESLYAVFNVPICRVSFNTGEYIKYLSNTMLATMISFSNEMSIIADSIGSIDVGSAFRILHMDKRWNDCDMKTYIYPGCGYGGYCLPKDTKALYSLTNQKGLYPKMLKETIAINDSMPRVMAERISNGLPKKARIGILGLSFKPFSDDVRDTPSARIISSLINDFGYKNIFAFDPVAMTNYKRIHNSPINYCSSAEEVINGSDVVAILTAWPEFKREYPKKIRVVDCRYIL